MSPRLFLRIASTQARLRMSYRADFWVQSVVVFAVEAGLVACLWSAVFGESQAATVGGYDRDGMILYSIAVILVSRLVRGNEFEGGLGQDVYDGGLTRYLLYPAPYLGFKYAQHVGSLVPLLGQCALFFAAFPLLGAGDAHVTVASAAAALLALAVAHCLHFLMVWTVQGVAFWADNVWSLLVALRVATGLLGGAMLPLSAFPPGARAVLEWLPFRHLFATPVEECVNRGLMITVGILLGQCLRPCHSLIGGSQNNAIFCFVEIYRAAPGQTQALANVSRQAHAPVWRYVDL